jgi:hypothetical protein
MNWLRAKLRAWLGIDEVANAYSFGPAAVNELNKRVCVLEDAQKPAAPINVKDDSKKKSKAPKYRTASEIRNKLERDSEEKA